MKPESFEKLKHLKGVIGQVSFADKVAFIADVSGNLQPDMLVTSNGKHLTARRISSALLLGL
jgi:hypothetical protein